MTDDFLTKGDYERAWNAAIECVEGESVVIDSHTFRLSHLQAPCAAFDEWYLRNVVDPPATGADWEQG